MGLVDADLAAGTVLVNEAGVGQTGALPPVVFEAAEGDAEAAPLQAPIPDPNPANNVDTATVTVATQADLGLDKDALPPNPAPGSTFAIELEVKNAGPSDA